MRVLFAATPPLSKVFALAPLAWAFRAAGHEVLMTFSEQTGKAAGTGLQIIDAAPGTSGNELLAEIFTARPELVRRWLEPLGDDPSPLAPGVAVLNRPFVQRTVELAEQWRPDLVVFEQSAPYGLIAAARIGVPAVQRNLGTIRTGGLHAATAAQLTDVLDRYDIAALPDPAMTLEFVPPSMLPFPEPEGAYMRYVPYTGGVVVGERLPEPAGRPRVVITMGGIRPGMHGLGPLEATVAAAGRTDADFLLALGDADPAPLGELPPNVVPIGWTPLDLLLPTCAAVVHHGGGGTAMAAVEAGVPQLVALDPRYLGHKTLAPAVEKGGVGLVTLQDEVTAATLERLLTDESLRKATADVRAESAALPSPAAMVPRLLDLALSG
ncbi:nucleotide disphospho-sugar-binding domain-containing protein [Actinomadura xylanilytica]|uniref:nucleotide disphospho-sugar-binding domain-containing protein n=1 Tax=Actinomadura xylanilytica TaxID=887459 RepID=UPI00255ACED1|nr:nucleotide disphospho-sugar-binding domain-containing protein [Actinomadura xylanilytica]MDL4776708.1 DUF1205 domain-containing protein [Actinomadura xylanilytica]